MKKLSFKISILGLAATAIIGSTGCDKFKDFKDTNVNPQVVFNPIPSALLTNAEAGIGGYATNVQCGYYVQYFAENQYAAQSLYNAIPQEFDVNYSGNLYDLQNIINYASDPKTVGDASNYGSINNQIAVATILQQYIYWTMTDRWGDIPYSEALQGKTPKYDKQEDIYKSMISKLKGAVTQIDGGIGPRGDILYGGDMGKWKKFANSLRMLMALRLSKQYPSAGQYSATEFAAAAADAAGRIETNADNLQLVFNPPSYNNPWYTTYFITSRIDNANSKTLTDMLTTLGDPRSTRVGGTTNGTPYGIYYSGPPILPFDTIEGVAYRQAGSPVNIVTAAAVLFAKAEAAERGWIGGSAQGFYDDGIAKSCEQRGVAGLAAGYASSGTANYNTGTGTGATLLGGTSVNGTNANTGAGSTSAEKLKRIALQRYIALYPDGTQAWSEWRRTGFPDFKPTVNAVNASKQIPRRLLYGQNEYATNPSGVAQGISTLTGGDIMDARVWWDKP